MRSNDEVAYWEKKLDWVASKSGTGLWDLVKATRYADQTGGRKNIKCNCYGQAFYIEGDYLGYEQVKDGNVNQTCKGTCHRPDGSPKSYFVQRVKTCTLSQPEELMLNADLITEHIRAKKQERYSIFTTPVTTRPMCTMKGVAYGGSTTISRL